ncbi:unnamed protein product [Gulo gulo]|uniref:Uncharacterized protein n=1 Tax=Gulo gulo TaxID=48420 RepID=A0A9X9Q6Q9_GULGU|nr:unnamed protein product [Gulo gulo]
MWPPLRGTEEDREGRGGGASGSSDVPRGSKGRDEPGRPAAPRPQRLRFPGQTRPAGAPRRGLADRRAKAQSGRSLV